MRSLIVTIETEQSSTYQVTMTEEELMTYEVMAIIDVQDDDWTDEEIAEYEADEDARRRDGDTIFLSRRYE